MDGGGEGVIAVIPDISVTFFLVTVIVRVVFQQFAVKIEVNVLGVESGIGNLLVILCPEFLVRIHHPVTDGCGFCLLDVHRYGIFFLNPSLDVKEVVCVAAGSHAGEGGRSAGLRVGLCPGDIAKQIGAGYEQAVLGVRGKRTQSEVDTVLGVDIVG